MLTSHGPDIWQGNSPATLINCTIVGSAFGAIFDYSTEAPTIQNCIITDNLYGIYRYQSDLPDPIVDYNNVWGNSQGSYIGEPFPPGDSSISVDPVFQAGYVLSVSSPCIDAGDPDPAYDDPDGSRNDMGAMHFVQPEYPFCFDEADVDGSGSVDVADISYLVDYLFRGGAPPPPCP